MEKQLYAYLQYKTRRLKPKIKFANAVEFGSTNNKCTLRCEFCPNSKPEFYDQPLKLADPCVFERIVSELERMKYEGDFHHFSQNEPFLDPRILDNIKMLRQRVPHVKISLETNGTIVNKDKLVTFFKNGGNLLRINVYRPVDMTDKQELALEVQSEIPGLIINDTSEQSTYYGIKLKDKVLQVEDDFSQTAFHGLIKKRINRGGSIEIGDDPKKYWAKKCVKPFRTMFINYLGEVFLCCNDWKNEVTFGNIMNQHLEDIWNSEKFFKFRYCLYNKKREILPVCSRCNYYGGVHQNALYIPFKFKSKALEIKP